MGRTRIVCIVNDAYLPEGDLSRLPFDVRGSRPCRFRFRTRRNAVSKEGREDPLRTAARESLAKALKRALGDSLDAVKADGKPDSGCKAASCCRHRRKGPGHVRVEDGVPFQVKFLIREPSGNVLSGIMMAAPPGRSGRQEVRAISGSATQAIDQRERHLCAPGVRFAHVASEQRRVPSSTNSGSGIVSAEMPFMR